MDNVFKEIRDQLTLIDYEVIRLCFVRNMYVHLKYQYSAIACENAQHKIFVRDTFKLSINRF